jgi:formylglycine-generating enzyme required for sulfatase activity
MLTLTLLAILGTAVWALFLHDWGPRAEGTGDTGGGTPFTPLPTPKSTEPGTHGNDGKNGKNGQTTIVTPGIVLPPGADRDPKAKVVKLADGREVYDWVVVRTGNHDVRFRLVTPVGGPTVRPFYIMESKVWNALFRDVVAVQPESEKNGPDAPVTFVTAEEAATFAWAAFGETCRLPTPDEFDHAAGLYTVKDRNEVTRPGGRPRVRIARPESTHGPQSGADVNEFDLLDMAGNGREFTNRLLTRPDEAPREVVGGSTTPLASTDVVILRGRNFTLSTGLTFQDLRDEQTKLTQRQFVTARSPYTSFRVVLPLP